MKKAIPWVVGVFLILIGVSSFAKSIIAGLLILIAGLLLLPPVIKFLASKEQLSFLATNAWASKVIASILVIVSITFSSSGQDKKLITNNQADQKMQQEAKNVAGSSPQSSESSDPDLIGKCLGYLGQEIEVVGMQNLSQPQKRYLTNHDSHIKKVLNANKTYPDCFSPGANIRTCLSSKNVNERDIQLLDGVNTGTIAYKDSTNRAMLSAACAN
jgi:hypothetical protein